MKRLGRIVFYMVATLALLLALLLSWDLVSILSLGWWRFLHRNMARITPDKEMIVTGMVFSAAVLGIGHHVARGFWVLAQTGRASPSRWRWKWTFGAYAGFWVIFAIAIGTAGLYYEGSWLLKDERPWYEERVYAYHKFRVMMNEVEQWLAQEKDDLERVRKRGAGALDPTSYTSRRQLLAENVQIVFFGQKTNGTTEVAAYLLVPRRAPLLSRGQFGLVDDAGLTLEPLSQLTNTIARLEAKYPGAR